MISVRLETHPRWFGSTRERYLASLGVQRMLLIMSLDQDSLPSVSEAQKKSGRGLGSRWNGRALYADGTAWERAQRWQQQPLSFLWSIDLLLTFLLRLLPRAMVPLAFLSLREERWLNLVNGWALLPPYTTSCTHLHRFSLTHQHTCMLGDHASRSHPYKLLIEGVSILITQSHTNNNTVLFLQRRGWEYFSI